MIDSHQDLDFKFCERYFEPWLEGKPFSRNFTSILIQQDAVLTCELAMHGPRLLNTCEIIQRKQTADKFSSRCSGASPTIPHAGIWESQSADFPGLSSAGVTAALLPRGRDAGGRAKVAAPSRSPAAPGTWRVVPSPPYHCQVDGQKVSDLTKVMGIWGSSPKSTEV